MAISIPTEDEAELEAFFQLIGNVVETAVRTELERYERSHLDTYQHMPSDRARDVVRE